VKLPRITPVQLTLLAEPFDDPAFLYEHKADGFRAVVYVSDGKCEIYSKRGNVFKSFQKLQAEIAAGLPAKEAIIDGEICVLDPQGRPLFYELMRRKQPPVLLCFDLLWVDGRDLRQLPLIERKRQLKKLIMSGKKTCPSLMYGQHIRGRGKDLFDLICKVDAEGITIKDASAPYGITARWFKVRNKNYTQMEGRHELFEGKTLKRAVNPKRKAKRRA